MHLFNRNLVNNPFCECGQIEDANHFLLQCPLFKNPRDIMINTISSYCLPSLNVLLYGDPELTIATNILIFESVHKFIISSKRFSN